MERLQLGRTGLLVSRIAMGGLPLMRLSKKKGVQVVKEVLDLGVNLIDTANCYGDSEEKIGEGLKGRNRDEIIVVSKSKPASCARITNSALISWSTYS